MVSPERRKGAADKYEKELAEAMPVLVERAKASDDPELVAAATKVEDIVEAYLLSIGHYG